jgi:hypothetical protein
MRFSTSTVDPWSVKICFRLKLSEVQMNFCISHAHLFKYKLFKKSHVRFIINYDVSRQVHSLFQCELSRQNDLELYLSVSSNLSFLKVIQ